MPCRAYHPQNVELPMFGVEEAMKGKNSGPGYCHRGDLCNFIHSEIHKGYDIPREDFYRL